MARANTVLSPRAAFWLLAVLLAFFLAAASAPSPLYPVYQAEWGFSATTLTAIYAVYAFGAEHAAAERGQVALHGLDLAQSAERPRLFRGFSQRAE